jgi:superfamily II DNA or RNA helicase
MSDVITVGLRDNVNLEIACEIDQAFELKEYFSCYATNYKFNPKFKAKMWNGKISFFNIHDKTLPIGLLAYLKPFLKKFKYKIRFEFDRTKLKNEITSEDLTSFHNVLFDGVKNNGKPVYPRDYQHEAILSALQHKRGVLEAATGAGKSIIIYSIIRFIMEHVKGKVLLVVPSINLVSQMFSDFREYGWWDNYDDVSLLYGTSKNYDPKKKVLISTWQSIHKKGQKFFEQFDAVLVDETHNAKSTSIQTVLKKCVNAEYKLGMTGTLPTEQIDRFNIFGYLGPVIYKLRSHELISRGFLSDIRIINTYLRYTSAEVSANRKRKYAEEISFITKNEKRNKVLKHIISSKNVKESENILILAQRLNHIDSIEKYLKDEYPNRTVLKISGVTNPEERERIRQYVECNDSVILVATYGTLSTGVNIPKLHHVIFASFYKSKIKVLQSIGRGLRLHKSKKIIYIWDIIDDMRWKKKKRKNSTEEYGYNYAFKHFLERKVFYSEQRFKSIDMRLKLEEL